MSAIGRLRNAPKLAPLITAIGMSFILQNVGLLWTGPRTEPVDLIGRSTRCSTSWATFVRADILAIGRNHAARLPAHGFVAHTRLGKAMRATAQDPEAARLMGINVDTTIALTFLLGGLLAGAAGLIYVAL